MLSWSGKVGVRGRDNRVQTTSLKVTALMSRVSIWRRVRCEGRQATKTGKTAPSSEGANRRADLVGRKVNQPSEDRNVGMGSCPCWETGKGTRIDLTEAGKPEAEGLIKAKGRSSVGRNVPSSKAFLNERALVSFG
jgi:hypothetical protein